MKLLGHNVLAMLFTLCIYAVAVVIVQLQITSLRPSDAYICISKLTIIGSDNGLSPCHRQAIIWTSAGILLILTLGTNFSAILSKSSCIFIKENPFGNAICEMAAILFRPQWIKYADMFQVNVELMFVQNSACGDL